MRADAVTEIDQLLHTAATLRAELRSFETSLRKARSYLGRGGTAAGMHDAIDIITTRQALTRAAVDFEAARRAARIAVFRAQLAEGMSVGAIARDWGFSRQLVSRMMKEDRAQRSDADVT
ncbi:MAG: hypothetical protein QOH10_2797 [Actinomycetota bacterium]|nr:hypothetical protein [Actinomycetota bacterium]